MSIVDLTPISNTYALDSAQLDIWAKVASSLTDNESLEILRIIVIAVDRSRLNEKSLTVLSRLFRFTDIWLKSAVELLSSSRYLQTYHSLSVDSSILMNRFRILTLIIAQCLDLNLDAIDYTNNSNWVKLISKLSIIYDLILNCPQKKKNTYLKQCHEILKNLLQKDIKRNLIFLETILKCDLYELKDQPKSSLIIGICVDASLYLQPDGKSIQKYVEPILKFIVQSMISSKTPVSKQYLFPLSNYYKFYISSEIYEAKKLQNFDKWMLRSPEVVLSVMNEITMHVVFDVGVYFSGKFCNGLLNQFKSKNEVIRNDAVIFYKTLVLKSVDRKALLEVAGIVLESIPSAPVDFRPYFYNALELISCGPSVSLKITRTIPQLITKETNDTVIQAALNAFTKHFIRILQQSSKFEVIKKQDQIVCFEFIIECLKNVNLRRYALYSLLTATNESTIFTLIQLDIEKLRNVLCDILRNYSDPKKPLIDWMLSLSILLDLRVLDTFTTPVSLQRLSQFFSKSPYIFSDLVISKLKTPSEQQVFADAILDLIKLPSLLLEIKDSCMSKSLNFIFLQGYFG
jgi:hypothetical protein